MSVRRTILSSVAGAAAAALSAAALAGISTYFSNEVGFFGPVRNWALVAAFEGFAYGIVPGAAIGFIVGTLRTRPLIGGIIGLGVWLFILLALLTVGMRPDTDDQFLLLSLAYIPI